LKYIKNKYFNFYLGHYIKTNMRHYYKLFFLFIFLFISTSISARTELAEGQKQANKLSLITAQSVYNLDN